MLRLPGSDYYTTILSASRLHEVVTKMDNGDHTTFATKITLAIEHNR